MSERLPRRAGDAIGATGRAAHPRGRRGPRAYEGDTVGSALAAAGVTSRPIVQVPPTARASVHDGFVPELPDAGRRHPQRPRVHQPVRDGMTVQRQNAWPSVDRDIHGWLDTFSFMMPPGFYYKVFQHPRWAWPLGGALHPVESRARQGASDRRITSAGTDNLHVRCPGDRCRSRPAWPRPRRRRAPGSTCWCSNRRRSRAAASPWISATGHGWRASCRSRVVGSEVLYRHGGLRRLRRARSIAAADSAALYRIRARHIVFATGAMEQTACSPTTTFPA